MSENRDLLEIIQTLIKEETVFLRHYIGEIVDNKDILNKGRLKITLPEIGMDKPDLALWCFPRQGMQLCIPRIGQYAEVYFINGDRSSPVYNYPVAEITNNTPESYKGIVSDQILYESPNNKDYIKYDDAVGTLEVSLKKELNVLCEKITLLEGDESFVLGDALQSFFDTFIETLNDHVHTGVTTGPGSTGPTSGFLSPTDILSSDIKGK